MVMEIVLVGAVILAALIGGFLLIYAKLLDLKSDAGIGILKQDLNQMTAHMNQRLDKAAEVFGGLQQELGRMQELGRGLRDIQDVLKSPKLRGNVGEKLMADLIKQSIPKENFQLQYEFKTKMKVDVVIKTRSGLIPIDAKFPVDNYLKLAQAKTETERDSAHKLFVSDVKKHITDIAKKYILPGEGTVDFALMYVPGESVYYEIMTNTDLDTFANRLGVYMVSPHTFAYFLKTILLSLEGELIEERAKEVLKAIKDIQSETLRFGSEFDLAAKHLGNAKSQMDRASSSFSRLGTKIESAGKLSARHEKAELPEPAMIGLDGEEE